MEEPQSLILNSPYEMPDQHWLFKENEGREIIQGRRKASYTVLSPQKRRQRQGLGQLIEIELVNKIRQRVNKWRANNYPGVTSISKKLLEYWNEAEPRNYPFFFCQLEAIETLIWLIETNEIEKTGLGTLPTDGGAFSRICSKLATGAGKTTVMAMLIVWQALNKITYPKDRRFSKNFLIITPNLTVKDRLSVLLPSHDNNYYEEFSVVESQRMSLLTQTQIKILNWQQLNWDSEEKIKKKKGVDKRGAKSDKAYIAEILHDMKDAKDIVVINDEAHHAWRIPPGAKIKGVDKSEKELATVWINGLDRIHRSLGINRCFDFSATPFTQSGNELKLFGWIVSDFGLNDAIEAGLVKIPQVCFRDNSMPDTKTFRSRLMHIFYDREVKDDLTRKKVPASTPLPDLVKNAYQILGNDWEATKKEWGKASHRTTPPVMITVANSTETAARIKYSFDNKDFIACAQLSQADGILHIDSNVIKQLEKDQDEIAAEDAIDEQGDDDTPRQSTKKQKAQLLRRKVGTVGQKNEPGENIQNVISVGMLSEGWDARTVTHIMGLRAFTSQLLCEQTIGRGLRRASYEIDGRTNRFPPEYVKVIGIPFNILPQVESTGTFNLEPFTAVQVDPGKIEHQISWPNVLRIEKSYGQQLTVDWDQVMPLTVDATSSIIEADLAPIINGIPDITQISIIDLNKLLKGKRLQTIIFELARKAYRDKRVEWQGSEAQHIADIARLFFEYIESGKLTVLPELFENDPDKKKVIIALNDSKILNHFWSAIRMNSQVEPTLIPVLDTLHPRLSTADMRPWRTRRPCDRTVKSHINVCVYDSSWESMIARELERNDLVHSWVKNDHTGFSIEYSYNGIIRKYYPDFIIRLTSGKMLILEVKGKEDQQSQAKHEYMKDWITAINASHPQQWCFRVYTDAVHIKDILAEAANDPQ